MPIHSEELRIAVERGIIDPGQAEALRALAAERQAHVPRFQAAHVLYYLGGLVAIGAVTLFITLAWEDWAGAPMLLLGLGLAGVGVGLSERFAAAGLRLPAGLTITFAVATAPLIVYSLQHAFGWWDGPARVTDYHRFIDWRWLFMELGTLAVASVALWRYREPFTVMLVALTLWYLSMDVVPLLQAQPGDWRDYFELRRLVTALMGAAGMLLAFWVDLRSRRDRDYAFWLYLAAVAMFWGGITAGESENELERLVYLAVNLALILVGTALRRRVFAVFGGVGVFLYLQHLAGVFRDSLLFPVALAAIGIAIIYAGVLWQRHESAIQRRLLAPLPGPLRALVERVQD